MKKKKFYITTTVARTLFFFSGQPRLWKEQFDVCVIAAEKEKLVAFSEQEGISYKYMPMHREISLLSDIACLFRFIWLFIMDRPYIVHGNTPKASMLSMVAAWFTRCPVRIYMCHGLRYQTAQGKLRKVLMAMEGLSCSCATEVISVSEGVRKQLVADGLCPEKKGKVVGYGTAGGVDVSWFSREAITSMSSVRTELGIKESSFVFCFVGRVVKDKGVNELVSAFDKLAQEYADVHLLVVGPAEQELDPISQRSEALMAGNHRIHVVGRQNDVRPYLAASDAFVLPSYREGVGMVLLEANAMDVPCIATDIIGCNDVVVPGVNGELVEPRNEAVLYEKMKEWVEHPEEVKRMAGRCRKFALSHYSHTDVTKAYAKEYSRLGKISDPVKFQWRKVHGVLGGLLSQNDTRRTLNGGGKYIVLHRHSVELLAA
ncbi:MAG: glycosyltransferase family 4 protein [Bacteroidales bacterium]|nr:glycosyltransferase family 4 protein [Bacteroidales bacterium]